MKLFDFKTIYGDRQEKANAKRRHEEDALQIACIRFFNIQWPRWARLCHHSPNEGLLPKGREDGAKRKKMGVRAGFPDIIILLPSGEYHYLAVELKTLKGVQSSTQRMMQTDIEQAGGCYKIVRSLDEFMEVTRDYMDGYEKIMNDRIIPFWL